MTDPRAERPLPEKSGLCSAHRDGEDLTCRICYPLCVEWCTVKHVHIKELD